MPFFKRNNTDIYYEVSGKGQPVIAVHGLIENTLYWSMTGVSEALSKHFEVVLMDMRAHGKTVVTSEPYGYDVGTVINDIEALADHLGYNKFHLISHSTGGFAAVRYAMENPDRLYSLSLTGTSSATQPFPDPDGSFYDKFAKSFENYPWEKILGRIKQMPFPFFTGIAETENNEPMWELTHNMIKVGNREEIGRFVRSFYTDPDPMIEGLETITCPTLILLGDKDILFIEPSKLMAQHIKESKHVVFKNTGHMLAIEKPEEFTSELIGFLTQVSTG